MSKDQLNIHIIGAGVSGLVAAIELERAGYQPTILEQSPTIGGRLKTDVVNGHFYDHGFQVLLTAYPAAKRYLNFDQLELIHFLPGSLIFKNGKKNKIGDPLRNGAFFWPTLLSNVGSIGDKLKVLTLSRTLKGQSLSSIFQGQEQSTLEYLKGYGFSDKIITNFFKPFFTGIFLEPELQTSSRMFEFVFKMFAEGYAAIPKYGIKAIPEHLKSKLNHTKIRLNTKVRQIDGSLITLDDGSTIESDKIIIATDPSPLLFSTMQQVEWHSCENLYFKAKQLIDQPIIGLIADEKALVNNFHYVPPSQEKGGQGLLSVTIVKQHQLSQTALIEQTKMDLRKHAGIQAMEFQKRFTIKKALPIKGMNLKYLPTPTEVQLSNDLILAGDYLSNGSLNAAMESGRLAAEVLIAGNKS